MPAALPLTAPLLRRESERSGVCEAAECRRLPDDDRLQTRGFEQASSGFAGQESLERGVVGCSSVAASGSWSASVCRGRAVRVLPNRRAACTNERPTSRPQRVQLCRAMLLEPKRDSVFPFPLLERGLEITSFTGPHIV